MASLDSFSEKNDRYYNSFRAQISDDENFESGLIRITPPVIIGDALLVNVSFEADIDLSHWAMNNEATLLRYEQKDEEYPGRLSAEERIRLTVTALLNELVYLAPAVSA